jgi:ribose 5-phosphate isomerase RpiB
MTYKFNTKKTEQHFSFFVSSDVDTFLVPRKPKAVMVNNWRELNGSEYDLSTPRFEDRRFTISGFIAASTAAAMWLNYDALITELEKPGILKVAIEEIDKEFDTTYVEITNVKHINLVDGDSFGIAFDLVLQEVSYVLDTYYDGGNLPPTAYAGIDKSVVLPIDTITLSGSATGSGISIVWTKVSGGAANFVTPNSASTIVNGLEQGVYVFRMTVTDDQSRTSFDEATITVALPAAPTVNAGVDRTITLPTNSLTVTATQTGTGVTVVWSKISGGAATITSPASLSTTITGLSEGNYTFRVTATDSFGRTVQDELSLTVQAVGVNQPPVVEAGNAQTITLPAGLTLSGTATDSDGTIASTVWTKVSGGAATITNANSLTTTVTGLAAGSYVFRLTANDNQGATTYDEVAITVQAANSAPSVGAGVDQSITLPTNSVTVTGTASDADGTIVSTVWSKVSGGAATITNPNNLTTTITGLVAGTYVFRMTATDNNGATSTDDVTINVAVAAGNVLERFDFGPAGLATTAGWTPLRGDPSVNQIEAIGLNGGVVRCGNYQLLTGLYQVGAAFDTGHTSALTYLDHLGASQTVPQSVMKGLWSHWLNTSAGVTIKGLTPGSSYYVTLFASISPVGGFTSTQNNKVKYTVTGATSVPTDGEYNFHQNSNDTTDGIRIQMTADTNGDIKVDIQWGTGQTLAGILNALEVRSV